MRILLVEDEESLANPLVEVLEQAAYAVDLAADGGRADELMFVNDYDLVVLDWTIPPPTGIELLGRWRAAGDATPVLMLTGRASIEDRVSGLDAGADDYLVKPFALVELFARLRALTRRMDARTDDAVLQIADLRADLHDRRVTRGDRKIDLSPREFALLTYLMRHRDQVVTRAMIAEHVWDQTTEHFSNVIDVYMGYLRKKIDQGQDERLLHTVRGTGYRLSEAP